MLLLKFILIAIAGLLIGALTAWAIISYREHKAARKRANGLWNDFELRQIKKGGLK